MNDFDDLITKLAAGLTNAAKKPNVYNYVPNPGGQESFHKSNKVGRLLAGDNRSGKTVGGIVEDVWWLTGKHPYQKTPEPPVLGRIVTVDFKNGAKEIIIPALSQWIPPSELIDGSWERSYKKSEHTLYLANGSVLDIKSHDQDLEAMAGVPRHFLHVDEECPRDIFNECKMRLLDYNGHYWITMTPIEGITWVYTDLVEGDPKNVEYFEIDVRDNKHISKEALETMESDFSDDEKQVRMGGGKNFVPKGGLVLKNFNYDRHVIKPGIPSRDWDWYVSVDSGYNAPAAFLWHVLTSDYTVITFYEHYRSLWTIEQHAKRIKEINRQLDKDPVLYICDPSMSRRNEITGTSLIYEYRRQGIPLSPGKNNVEGGILKMNDYLRRDKWKITSNCSNLIREMRMYRFKTFRSSKAKDENNPQEKPQKKDDHACDSSRYYFNFLPKLETVENFIPSKKIMPEDSMERLKQYPWHVDSNLLKSYQSIDVSNRDLGWGEIE